MKRDLSIFWLIVPKQRILQSMTLFTKFSSIQLDRFILICLRSLAANAYLILNDYECVKKAEGVGEKEEKKNMMMMMMKKQKRKDAAAHHYVKRCWLCARMHFQGSIMNSCLSLCTLKYRQKLECTHKRWQISRSTSYICTLARYFYFFSLNCCRR